MHSQFDPIAVQRRETRITEFLLIQPKFLHISKTFYHHIVLHIICMSVYMYVFMYVCMYVCMYVVKNYRCSLVQQSARCLVAERDKID